MTKDDLQSVEKFLSSNVEPELIKFLLNHHKNFIGGKLTAFPKQYRDISVSKLNEEQIIVSYPKCERDDFLQTTGLEISYFDKGAGEYSYLGNISLMIVLEKDRRSWQVVGYSYKYWFANNSYILCATQPLQNKINFNFRLDWDKNHQSDGLEYHATFLHSLPRIHTKNFTLENFFTYLESNVLPFSKAVVNGIQEHIGVING